MARGAHERRRGGRRLATARAFPVCPAHCLCADGFISCPKKGCFWLIEFNFVLDQQFTLNQQLNSPSLWSRTFLGISRMLSILPRNTRCTQFGTASVSAPQLTHTAVLAEVLCDTTKESQPPLAGVRGSPAPRRAGTPAAGRGPAGALLPSPRPASLLLRAVSSILQAAFLWKGRAGLVSTLFASRLVPSSGLSPAGSSDQTGSV